MHINKKFALLLASLLLVALSLTGCLGVQESKRADGALTGGGSKTIYIITPSETNPIFVAESDAAAIKAKALGYDIVQLTHNDDVATQSAQIADAIEQKAAAIILDNAGAEATVADIIKAREANIPTFLIDREISINDVAISQIMSNNALGAKAVAEAFVESMGEEGAYAELLGLESDTNTALRSSAFQEVLVKYPRVERVAQETANWNQEMAEEKVSALLATHPNLKGILCGNDTMAIGAINALQKAGRLGEIAVAGFDGSSEAANAIRHNHMVATALQQAPYMAELAVEQADAYLKTGKTGQMERQVIECILITKDNVKNLHDFVYKRY